MTSWPARVWASTETRLPWVPEDTNSAASLPVRRAATSSSRRTVGSSSHTSSPTSARPIASRMAWVGRVRVSERRSTTSCMGRLPRGGLESLGRALAPVGVGVLFGHLPEHPLSFLGPAVALVHLTQPEQRLRGHERPRELLDDLLESLARRGRVALVDVVGRHPQLLLREAPAADVGLGEGVGRVAALRVLTHEHLEGLHRLPRDLLVLLHRLHLVVVAHRQPELGQVGDLVARIERHEGLELLDGLVELSLAVERLADQEAGPRRVARLGVPLGDLAKRGPRVLEPALAELALAFRVQLRSGRQRLRPLAKEIRDRLAPAREQEQTQQHRGNREEFEAHRPGVGHRLAPSCKGGSLESQGHRTGGRGPAAGGAGPRRWYAGLWTKGSIRGRNENP